MPHTNPERSLEVSHYNLLAVPVLDKMTGWSDSNVHVITYRQTNRRPGGGGVEAARWTACRHHRAISGVNVMASPRSGEDATDAMGHFEDQTHPKAVVRAVRSVHITSRVQDPLL